MSTQLRTNLILMTDSYKLSHLTPEPTGMYPDGTCGMFGYIEARTKGDIIIPVGLKMYLMKYLSVPVTLEDLEEAEQFALMHGEPFNYAMWEKIITVYNGFLPIVIKAVPEGTPLMSGNVMVTVSCEDPDCFGIVSSIETMLQRAVWYPTTIASNDHKVYKLLAKNLKKTSDNPAAISFMYHDFGGRGVSSHESAEIGGMAHLVHFMGSDTMEGVRAANFYYNCPMSAFSVIATEHSVQTSFGSSEADQEKYLSSILTKYAKPGKIVSIVIDGYDMMREATKLCTVFKDQIIASGAKIVFRPDSGDAITNVIKLLDLQAEHFGFTVNSKGFKVINHVAVIQGDGVDYRAMELILHAVKLNEYSVENVVFGSGGALLQKVNRDTYRFAQKASAIKTGPHDIDWKEIFKNPITDPGKVSKKGLMTLIRNAKGELETVNIHKPNAKVLNEVLTVVYDHGVITCDDTLDIIRTRALSDL